MISAKQRHMRLRLPEKRDPEVTPDLSDEVAETAILFGEELSDES